MPTLNALTALPTTAEVDVELAVDRLTGDLNLELLGDVCLVERPATVGASVWQRRLVGFIDLVGLRWQAVGFGAVLLAALASRLLGVGLRWSFGEGGGLTLAGALLLLKQASQVFDLGFQFGDASLEHLATGASGFFHAGMVAKRPVCSCAPRKSHAASLAEALTK
jgi:hypothetical protein